MAQGQTFEVNPSGNSPSTPAKQSSPRTSRANPSNSQTLGWGSNIEVARQSRAAQAALNRGDYGAATAYAEQAAKSAPDDPELWFELGYAARLAGRYQQSIDAYQRGMKLRPNAIQGFSGLAQTYAKMGRDQEAR